MSATVFLAIAALLGGVPSFWGVFRDPGDGARAPLRDRRPRCRRGRSSGRATPPSPSSCASWCSRCSCSRERSSRSAVSRIGSSRSRSCRRCITPVELCRDATLRGRRQLAGRRRPHRGADPVHRVGRVVGPAHVQPDTRRNDRRDRRRRRRGGAAAARPRLVDTEAHARRHRARGLARRRAQHHRVPAPVVPVPHRAHRARAVPVVDRHRRGRPRGQGEGPRWRADRLLDVRRTRAARDPWP